MSEETGMTRQNKYNIVLDYLRIAAMLGVLLIHFSAYFPVPGLSAVAKYGKYGVQVFFVISAYLGCSFFSSGRADTLKYYKRRALRILPTYYAAIIVAIVYVECVLGGFVPDSWHLGWLRYFLGLNTILPSNSFGHWNNCFAFWTMTEFILFYAIVPYLLKLVYNFRRCLVFFIICCVVAYVCRKGSAYIPETCFSDPAAFIRFTPLCQMQYFALGMLGYFAARENKTNLRKYWNQARNKGLAVLWVVLALLPAFMAGGSGTTFALIALACILYVRNDAVMLQGKSLALVRFVARYSFHVYLTHFLALGAAEMAVKNMGNISGMAAYGLQFVLTIGIIFLLCAVLELAQRICNKWFARVC